MPTQHDMNADSDIYRAVMEYEVQPTMRVKNPHYDPNYRHTRALLTPREREQQPWMESIYVPEGPKVTSSHMIGPYQTIAPIKAYVTRHRSQYDTLRIKSIQRVTVWEEVNDA